MSTEGPFRFTNRTGKDVDDFHCVFRGTGGSLRNPKLTLSPVPGGIAASGNTVDIKWISPIPDGSVIEFTVESDFPGIQVDHHIWTTDGKAIEGPKQVVNSEGYAEKFTEARIVGRLTMTGLDQETALSRSQQVVTIVEASGRNTFSTDDIRYILEELANPIKGPDYEKIGRYLGRVAAEVVPPETHPSRRWLISTVYELIDHLSDLNRISESSDSPLGSLLEAGSRYLQRSLGETGVREHPLSSTLERMAFILQEGTYATGSPKLFLAWRDVFVEILIQFAGHLEELPASSDARLPLNTLAESLSSITDETLHRDEFEGVAWQTVPLNKLAALPTSSLLLQNQAILLFVGVQGLLDMDLTSTARVCPPCPADCSHVSSTTYKTRNLTNPRNCKTKFKRLGFGRLRVPFVHVWLRTCTWDSFTEYKRVYQCRKDLIDPFGVTACCWSSYEWSRNETVEYTQQQTTLSSTVPDNWDSEVEDIRVPLWEEDPPPDAEYKKGNIY